MATEQLTIRIDARNRASRALRSLRGQIQRVAATARRLAAAFAAITAAVTGVGILAVREFTRFEDALTGVAKTVDAPEAELRALADTFRDVSEQIPVSTNELLRIAQLGGQLGVATDNLQTFAETIAALDVATDLGAEEGALALARFSEVLQIAQEDIDRVGSAVVELGNNFAVTESELVDTQQFFASTANAAGFTAGEVLGLAAAIRSAGVRAQSGGSAVMVAIQEIGNAVEGTNDKLEDFARVAGISGTEFARTFREDASEALALFVEGLGETIESGGSLNQILEELELNDRRVTRGLTALASAQGLVRDTMESGNRAFAENTALTEEAARFYDRLGARLQVVRNRVQNVAAEFGEELEPIVNDLIDAFGQFLEGLRGSREEFGLFVERLSEDVPGLIEGIVQSVGQLTEQLVGVVDFFRRNPLGGEFGLVGLVFLGPTGAATFTAIGAGIDSLMERFRPTTVRGQLEKKLRELNTEARRIFNILRNPAPWNDLEANAAQLEDINRQIRGVVGTLQTLGNEGQTAFGRTLSGARGFAQGLQNFRLDSSFSFGGGTPGGDGDGSEGAPFEGDVIKERTQRFLLEPVEDPELGRAYARALEQNVGGAMAQFQESMKAQMATIGGSLVMGLMDGARSMTDQLKSFFKNVVGLAITLALRSQLGIASPSKVTREIGQQVGMGLALGMEDTFGRIRSAAGRMGATAAAFSAPRLNGMGQLAAAGRAGAIGPEVVLQFPEAGNAVERALQDDWEERFEQAEQNGVRVSVRRRR